jgi:hypothetical protein
MLMSTRKGGERCDVLCKQNRHVRTCLEIAHLVSCFLFGLLFNLEDGRDMCLRNVGPSANYTVLELEDCTLHSAVRT